MPVLHHRDTFHQRVSCRTWWHYFHDFIHLHAVLGFFQMARSMMEEMSSLLKALVIAPPPPPKQKEYIEKSAFSPAARAWLSRACVITDMGAFLRMETPSSASREMLGNNYPRPGHIQPMANPTVISCSTAVTGHVTKHL